MRYRGVAWEKYGGAGTASANVVILKYRQVRNRGHMDRRYILRNINKSIHTHAHLHAHTQTLHAYMHAHTRADRYIHTRTYIYIRQVILTGQNNSNNTIYFVGSKIYRLILFILVNLLLAVNMFIWMRITVKEIV